jgi:hypothetical protein
MMVMEVLVMMMMIPMKPSSITMMMAMISPPPLSGKEFPWQISACRRAFSLSLSRSVFSELQRRWSLSANLPPGLGFQEDDIRERVMPKVDHGGHTTWRCSLVMTHKYRGSQQSSREVKPKFIDSTQGKPKDIYKP